MTSIDSSSGGAGAGCDDNSNDGVCIGAIGSNETSDKQAPASSSAEHQNQKPVAGTPAAVAMFALGGSGAAASSSSASAPRPRSGKRHSQRRRNNRQSPSSNASPSAAASSESAKPLFPAVASPKPGQKQQQPTPFSFDISPSAATSAAATASPSSFSLSSMTTNATSPANAGSSADASPTTTTNSPLFQFGNDDDDDDRTAAGGASSCKGSASAATATTSNTAAAAAPADGAAVTSAKVAAAGVTTDDSIGAAKAGATAKAGRARKEIAASAAAAASSAKGAGGGAPAAAAAPSTSSTAGAGSATVAKSAKSIGLRRRIVRAKRPRMSPSDDEKKDEEAAVNTSNSHNDRNDHGKDSSSDGSDDSMPSLEQLAPRLESRSTNRFAALNDDDSSSEDDDNDDSCSTCDRHGCRANGSDCESSASDTDSSTITPSRSRRVQCAICFERCRVESLVTLPCCGSGRTEESSSTRFCVACIVKLGKRDWTEVHERDSKRCFVGECPRCRQLIAVTLLGSRWNTPNLANEVRVSSPSFAMAAKFASEKVSLKPLLFVAAFSNPNWIPVEMLGGDNDRASRLVLFGILDKPKRDGVYTIDPEKQVELRRLQPTRDGDDDHDDDDEDDYVPCFSFLTANLLSVAWDALWKAKFVLATRLFNQALTTALFASGLVPGRDQPLRPWQGWVITTLNVFICTLVMQCLTIVAVYALTLYGSVKAVGSALHGKPIPRWLCGVLYACAVVLTEDKRLSTLQYCLLYISGLALSKGRIPRWLYGGMFVEVLTTTKFGSRMIHPIAKVLGL